MSRRKCITPVYFLSQAWYIEEVQPKKRVTPKGRPPLPERDRRAIRRKFARGNVTREELAAEYGISYNTVRNILKEGEQGEAA